MGISLTDEQQAVVDFRGQELLVSAAAGSGKTRVLVERLLSRVENDDLNVNDFLIITFTKAAASELRDKIIAELHTRLNNNLSNVHLRKQLTLVYTAQISTIHAFCSGFLRENSHLIGLEPDFRVADENEADILRVNVLDKIFETLYENIEENGLKIAVEAFSDDFDDTRLKTIVLDIHKKIQAHPEPIKWLDEQVKSFDTANVDNVSDTLWGDLLVKDSLSITQYWKRKMTEALGLMELSDDDKIYTAYAKSFNQTLDCIDQLEQALNTSWDDACEHCEIPFPRLGTLRKPSDVDTKNTVTSIRKKCQAAFKKLAKRFDCNSAELLYDLSYVKLPIEQLFNTVRMLNEQYNAEKLKRKLLDFNDLEHLTVNALTNSEHAAELVKIWSNKYAEVMVDEYQDTNEVQNVIFNALTNGGRKLFEVGDVKQSIYRFRLADPGIFIDKYNRFSENKNNKNNKNNIQDKPQVLILSKNFRSRKSVLDATNFLFKNVMSSRFGDINYDENHYLNLGLENLPDNDENTELDIIDMFEFDKEQFDGKITRDDVEVKFVANRIYELLKKPCMVTDKNKLRPVQPDDIAILHRSPSTIMRSLTRELNKYNIPWQTENAESYFNAVEVLSVFAFLEVIDNPRQDIPLISVLRSPIYNFTADDLAELKIKYNDEADYYARLKRSAEENSNNKCLRFIDDLNKLRLYSVEHSCAQLIHYIYDYTGLLSLYGSMANGEKRIDNLTAFYSYANDFERISHKGVFSFVNHLRKLYDNDKLPLNNSNSGSGVKIMSIHKSKGLEFPIVILCGLSKQFNTQDEKENIVSHSKLGVGPKIFDRDRSLQYPTIARTAIQLQLNREMKSEELRLLYVAMTRAKDKLVMTMSFQNFSNTVIDLQASVGERPDPETLFAQNSISKIMLLCILGRCDAQNIIGDCHVEPVNASDKWDISLVKADNVFSKENAIVQEIEDNIIFTDIAKKEQFKLDVSKLLWKYPNSKVCDIPSKVTATQLKGRYLDDEVSEDAQKIRTLEFRQPNFEQKKSGLTPAQRGSAIHSVLELIDINKTNSIQAVQLEIERLVSENLLTIEQAKAVKPYNIFKFWTSDIGKQAKMSDNLMREFKFSVLMPVNKLYKNIESDEKILMQGVVDCCFEDDNSLTVVDFKSDYVEPDDELNHAQQYLTQVDAYSMALSEIFKKPVKQRVIWFLSINKGIVI